MPTLRVDLQEGFDDDAVEIYVNGAQVLQREGVTTKRTIGLALSAEIDVPEAPFEVEIKVPSRNLSHKISVAASDSPNLGISISNDEIKIIKSERRFGYA